MASFLLVFLAAVLSLSSAAPSIKRADAGFRTFLGLPSDDTSLSPNGISLGVLPDMTDPANDIQAINAALSPIRKVASHVGDYIQISSASPNMGQISAHLESLLAQPVDSQGLYPVYVPAIMPTLGLQDFLDNNLSDVVALAAQDLNDQGIYVWLRFGYEMNGAWMVWGQQPDLYIQAFGALTAAVRALGLTKTLMLWSPNILSGSGDINSIDGYTPYYPGDDLVDIVGLSFYSFGVNQTENTVAPPGMFVDGFTPFYNLYSHKAVMIAETSAPYHLLSASYSDPAAGGADERSMKSNWLSQLTSQATANLFPQLIAVCWFNYVKEEKGGQYLDHRMFTSADGGVNTAGLALASQ